MSETTQQPEAPATTGLTVQDLTLTLQIIQAVTARGAIKADEMAVVGGLYERIFKFLDSIGALSRTQEESAAEALASEEQPTEKPAKKGKKQ
jgi:glutamate synthase domain-containing protein 1